MVKAKLKRLGLRRPRLESLKRKSRALRGDLLQATGRESFVAPPFESPDDGAETFLWRLPLVDAVAAAAEHEPRSREAVAHVIERAEEALSGPLYSVVDKLWTPPSGSKHDYFSGPAYWWPTPDAPMGVPWSFRDGHMNPVRFGDEFDLTRLDRLAEAVKMLSLGWRFTRRAEFAEKAAMLVRTWFLDPATAMRPNLTYAQIVPGRTRLTGTGIIETLRFVAILDSLGVMAESGAIAAAEQDDLREWFSAYLTWLRTSENGRLEQATNNNHGLSYDIQLISYALFTRDLPLARQIAGTLAKQRIYNQVHGDGTLPEEMRRKEAFFYVAYGVGFLFDLATVAERAGVDLWRFRAGDGSGIETAWRALIPYALDRKPWPHGGKRVPAPELYAIALRGAHAYGEPELEALAARYAATLPLQPIDLIMPPPH